MRHCEVLCMAELNWMETRIRAGLAVLPKDIEKGMSYPFSKRKAKNLALPRLLYMKRLRTVRKRK